MQVESANEHLMRNRRQTPVTRFNLYLVLQPFIANNDLAGCNAVCEEYTRNEVQRALADPLRGPNPRLRILFRRFLQTFHILGIVCQRSICGRESTECSLFSIHTHV